MLTVYRPKVLLEETPGSLHERAPRKALKAGSVLALIDNNKPRARVMLEYVAEQLRNRLPIGEVITYTKPTAGEPIEPQDARELAMRAQLVVAGVGD